MNGADPPSPPDERDAEESEAILRAKYLDYCSAQLAHLLLFLTPDEIYLLAQQASHEAGGRRAELSYVRMMEVATEWLSSRVPLPPFEIWLEDYEQHPERYEADLMGLWETEPFDPV